MRGPPAQGFGLHCLIILSALHVVFSWTDDGRVGTLACAFLRSPNNGCVKVSSYHPGGTASYSCDTGYVLRGVSRFTCRSAAWVPNWNGSPPSCSRICSPPNHPSNGLVIISFDYNFAMYACNTGYSLSSSSNRRCQSNGVWSGSQPSCSHVSGHYRDCNGNSSANVQVVTCPVLTALSNGATHASSREYSDIATYTCDPVYELIGSSRRTCQSNGAWSGSKPTCLRICCPSLSDPPNGRVSVGSHYVGSSATYSCSRGYRRVGASSRVCLLTKAWSGSPPSCTRIVCPTIRVRSNDHMSVRVSSTYVDGRATYSCLSGYEMDGSATRTCEATGAWSGSQPSCSVVTCPVLTALSNGATHASSREYSDIATYTCDPVYELIGSSRRTCQSNGAWSGSKPTCLRIRCPSLSDPPNGRVSDGSRYVGSSATYSCSRGYRRVGASSRVCLLTKAWSGSPPSCTRIVCPTIRVRSNDHMSVRVSSSYVGGRATYSCSSGYEMDGSATRTCEATGAWSDSQTSCSAISCPTLSAPNNGDVAYGSTILDSVARYTCDSDYELVGPSSRTCLASGRWSSSQPYCRRLRCPYISGPNNGRVSVSSYYTGGIANYSCLHGYKLEGSLSRFCGSKTWRPFEPVCSRIICPTVSEPGNGTMTVNVTSYYVGGVASYTCPPSHDMIGLSNVTCQATGAWSGPQPMCLEKCVPSIGFNQSHLRIEEGDTTAVCITSCSCTVQSNFTVELKARNQIDIDDIQDDLRLPTVEVIEEGSMCFNVTAIEDDILEGFEVVYIELRNPGEEKYDVCPDKSVISVLIADNDELTIGFEKVDVSVNEGAGQVEICVVVFEPNATVPIPDVVLDMKTFYFGEAKPRSDYTPIANYPLPFTESKRKICLNLVILEDAIIENDESFSIMLERNSSVSTTVPLLIEPEISTVKIMDNDGVNLGFEKVSFTIDETSVIKQICIQARFSAPNVVDDFSLVINSHSILADGDDYKNIKNLRIGPFSYSSNKICFDLSINDDADVEPDEGFTLAISGEPANVKVKPRVMLVTIKNDDEPSPCNSPLRVILPDLFKHCSDLSCTYTDVWSIWEEVPESRVDVSNEVCPSRKMGVNIRYKNATKAGCDRKQEKKQSCIPTMVEQLFRDIGVGNNMSSFSPPPQTTPNPRGKRSVQNQSHCYDPEETPELQPLNQCQVFQSCPYDGNQIQSRDPHKSCSKRSVLFVVDASSSIGETLFQDISVSLSYLVKNFCGDIQFGLLKFSSGAYLEFCFDCYSNDQREELQTRIRNIKYVGHSSFTGYATKCAHNFMFDSSCGQHDDRCIDIVYVTDGESSDRLYFDVCDEIECMHKNPAISEKLKVYAIGVGGNLQGEIDCITKYSKLRDNSQPIFSFENLDELIVELNVMIRKIELEQHKYRVSGQKPKYDCDDWIKGG